MVKSIWNKLEIRMQQHCCSTFVDDGDLCDKAKPVQELLKKIKTIALKWPGNSPHLNSKENLQAYTKNKVTENQSRIRLLWTLSNSVG